MEKRILSLYLSRILSGQYIFLYDDTTYKLIYPDISIKYEAELYAHEEYEKNKYNGWITQDDALSFLVEIGVCTYDSDTKIKNAEKQIEDIKIDLFQSFLNPNKLKAIRSKLQAAKKYLSILVDNKHSLDSVTLEGFTEMSKNQFILINSLYNTYNEKIFKDINNIDYRLLNDLLAIINNNAIDIKIFRKIARSDIWRNYWSSNKDFLFDKPTINWTDEQKTLVVMSKMYDNAYESMECPPDEVIEDDDMFDGWMIMQRREIEKSKAKNRNEKMLKDKNLGNAKEVFLVANSKEEAQNIYSLNDNNSRHIIRERNSFLATTDKSVSESQLPDVQRELVMQNNQKFIQSRKK